MQELLANGNYTPFLAQALMPPGLGATGMMGSYGSNPGIGQQFGNLGFANSGMNLAGQQGFGQQPGQQFGQPHQIASQQQQVAATLHQLAHQAATNTAIGQQIGATLQQLAQYCASQVVTGQQFAQLLNQLAHQCAWTAQAARGGAGMQPGFGQPFGGQLFGGQPFGYGQSYAQPWGASRPLW